MEQLTFNIRFNSNALTYDDILMCIEKLLLFSPERINFTESYSKDILLAQIKEGMDQASPISITLSDEKLDKGNSLSIHVKGGNPFDLYTSFIGRVKLEVFNRSNLVEGITALFEKFEGIYAYVVSTEDNRWQNNESIDLYKSLGKSLEGIQTIPRPKMKNKWIVDINQFPGHSHNYKGIWFGSCWMMWYGKEYYEYVDKEKLMTFKDCDENILLAGDAVRIKLYENPLEFHTEENRRKQWEFRKYANIDDAAEKLRSVKRYLKQ